MVQRIPANGIYPLEPYTRHHRQVRELERLLDRSNRRIERLVVTIMVETVLLSLALGAWIGLAWAV